MLVKKIHDHNVVNSHICGVIREIIIGEEYEYVNIALSVDIGITQAHYHKNFDEIYMVIDGELTLVLYDPSQSRTWTINLSENELCVIPKRVHHKVTAASSKNRLLLVTVPRFNEEDQHISDVI